MTNDSTAIVYVTYQGTPDSKFDRDYYVSKHLPLAMASWKPHGLESVRAFFPAVAEEGTIALAELRFRDAAAASAALASPEAAKVIGDVPQFTDVTPDLGRSTPL